MRTFNLLTLTITLCLLLSSCQTPEESAERNSKSGHAEIMSTDNGIPADNLSNSIDKIVAVNQALPAGSALLPNNLIYIQKPPDIKSTAAVYNDKMALSGGVLARDLARGAPIFYADIAQINGSAKRKTARDVLVSTKDIEAGEKLDSSNTGYWTPTPNYRPMMVQMAFHDRMDIIKFVASKKIPRAQILTVSNVGKKYAITTQSTLK